MSFWTWLVGGNGHSSSPLATGGKFLAGIVGGFVHVNTDFLFRPPQTDAEGMSQ